MIIYQILPETGENAFHEFVQFWFVIQGKKRLIIHTIVQIIVIHLGIFRFKIWKLKFFNNSKKCLSKNKKFSFKVFFLFLIVKFLVISFDKNLKIFIINKNIFLYYKKWLKKRK